MLIKKKTENKLLIEAITNNIKVMIHQAIDVDGCVINDIHLNRDAIGSYLISVSMTKPGSPVIMSFNPKEIDLDLEGAFGLSNIHADIKND